jgi:hypothetical protein
MMHKNNNKNTSLERVEATLKGTNNHLTLDSDVSSEPFPFTEEDHSFKEQIEFKNTSRNNPT